MKTNIRFPGRGIIGWIEGNTFFSKRDSKIHSFRKFGDGFGLSESVLDFLISQKIAQITLIIDSYTPISTLVDVFLVKGEDYTDLSSGKPDKQIILPLKFWKKDLFEIVEKQGKLNSF